jgi:hypothetical protein
MASRGGERDRGAHGLGRHMTILISHSEQDVKQALLVEISVAAFDGGLYPLGMARRTLTGPGDLAVIVEAHDHRNRQTARHIQPL